MLHLASIKFHQIASAGMLFYTATASRNIFSAASISTAVSPMRFCPYEIEAMELSFANKTN
jgi:hypothetical protein